jgi:hypothetical protein
LELKNNYPVKSAVNSPVFLFCDLNQAAESIESKIVCRSSNHEFGGARRWLPRFLKSSEI